MHAFVHIETLTYTKCIHTNTRTQYHTHIHANRLTNTNIHTARCAPAL